MIDQSAQRPTEDDLLAYVQGTLPPEALAKVEAAMEADPALAADVAFMSGLKGTVQSETSAQNSPGEFGWRKLEAEMNRADVQAPKQARPWMQYVAAGLA